jgi:hypothetical protein
MHVSKNSKLYRSAFENVGLNANINSKMESVRVNVNASQGVFSTTTDLYHTLSFVDRYEGNGANIMINKMEILNNNVTP